MSNLARRAIEAATKMPQTLVERNRKPPQWWSDAGLGIFIHWGLYSVPAFAPTVDLVEIIKSGHPAPQSECPYSEWYQNSMMFPDSSVAKFHRDNYGDAPYSDFREPFEAGLDTWDPRAWAESFARTGATYVVMVTKHHDGYCMWPTDVPNPHAPDFHSKRDLVGELADAVRGAGMRFGIYYSGGYDWTFSDRPQGSLTDAALAVPFDDYPAYASAQVRELIDRYEPSVLWNDICWPDRNAEIFKLFEHYFSVVPDGCVNDRWLSAIDLSKLLTSPRVDNFLENLIRKSVSDKGIVPPPIPFMQFRTPEYAELPNGMKGPWEMTRGLDLSFAYNRYSTDEDYLGRDELLTSLMTTMSRGGNFLINVGPKGDDGSIPDEQLKRLGWMAEQNAVLPWSTLAKAAKPKTRPQGGHDG